MEENKRFLQLKVRKLLKVEEYQHIFIELKKLPKELNQLISYTNQKSTI